MTKSKQFKISIQVNGETLGGVGETALDALRAIKKPVRISTKGIINITDGEKSKQMVFMPFKLRKLFFPSNQPTLSKFLTLGMQ